MGTSSTWNFSRLEEAEKAHAALLACGIAAEDLHMDVVSDEAAPVQGNFALDYKDAASSNDDSFLDKVFTVDDPNEGQGRQDVEWHCVCILVVKHSAQNSESLARETLAAFETRENP